MKTNNHLDKILKDKQEEVKRLIALTTDNPDHPLNILLRQSHASTGAFAQALKSKPLSVIAEVKRRSPSVGVIQARLDPVTLALKYCKGGAAAISVLTDAVGFGGSLEDLHAIAIALKQHYPHVPILRKDFILHPLQLAEAVYAGASAVLLIVSIVGKDLPLLLKEASRLGLETLTEVHNISELELALEAGSPIIGINHRNLKTFEMDMSLSETLRSKIPPHIITVAESGIHEVVQAQHLYALDYDAILVGEALVKSHNPVSLLQQMRGV